VPGDQVFALKNRKTGKISKGGSDEVITIPDTTDTGIGIKAG
jgi:hypothetical protein